MNLSTIYKNGAWLIFFVDDIVQFDKSSVEINLDFELWRQTVDMKGFIMSRTKIECAKANFWQYSKKSLKCSYNRLISFFK